MKELNYVYFLWFYVLLDHLLKRTIHRYCTDILSYFSQCLKDCFFTALSSCFWCLYSLRNFFFTVSPPRLSLPTNIPFLKQILHFYKWCENTLFSQMSHGLACHSIPNFPPWLSVIIFTGIYTCWLVKLSQKSLGFLLGKRFHPTRLCLHPSFSEAIASQLSTLSYMFWALSGAVLLSFCSPQSYFWASLAMVSIGVEKQGQMSLSVLFNLFFNMAALAKNATDIKVFRDM